MMRHARGEFVRCHARLLSPPRSSWQSPRAAKFKLTRRRNVSGNMMLTPHRRTVGAWGALYVRFKSSILRQLISVEAAFAFAVTLTALAIWFQEPLTHRTLSFAPKDLGTSFYSYGYDDHHDGGHSKA